MTVRRHQEPGGRKIRHVVLTSPEEEERLQAHANARGITVARLLVENTLSAPGVDLRGILREVSRLREDLVHGSLSVADIEITLNALVKRLEQ